MRSKNMKKALAILLVLTMCLQQLPLSAFAADDTVPVLEVTVAPGTADGSTTVTVTDAVYEKFVVNITDFSVEIPNIGDPAPAGGNVIDPYISGDDITIGIFSAGRYLQVYNVDADGKVVGFYQQQLAIGDIKEGKAVDHAITVNGSSFQVDGGGSYTTLAGALEQCNLAGDDGELVVKLGDADTPLALNEVFRNTPANNQLITATYTGNIQIQNIGTAYAAGLVIPNDVTATFRNLTLTQSGTAGTEFYGVYLVGNGSLNIREGTSITVSSASARCVHIAHLGAGTVNMTAGSLAAIGSEVYGAIDNYENGTVNISGGVVSSESVNGSAVYNRNILNISGTARITGNIYGIYNLGNNANANISDGTVEATSVSGRAIYTEGTGSITMSGGAVRATNNNNSNYDNYGIYNNGSTVNISGGTVSTAGIRQFGNTAAILNIGTASTSISGAANITGTRYGIYSSGTKTSDNGAVYITGGTVTTTGIGDYYGTSVINAGTGLITIAGGTISNAISSAAAITVNNSSSGTINISGGTVSKTGTAGAAVSNSSSGIINISSGTVSNAGTIASATAVSNTSSGTINISGGTVQTTNPSAYYAVSNTNGGTVNISGGTVSCAGTGAYAAAVNLNNGLSVPTVSAVDISGAARIISASNNTVRLNKFTTADKEKAIVFGKAIYSDTLADVVITGANESVSKEINSGNYGNATVTASNITSGNSFICWTSDFARTLPISSTNGASLNSLTTGAYTGVMDIYLKAADTPVSVPTVLPTNGSFADTDDDADQIGGTITWTAADPADGITGYRIYWGSDATTKLEGHTDVLYAAADVASTSQAVEADTPLPAGAAYFLIYSYNTGGDSASRLAVAITDLIPAPTILPTGGSFSDTDNEEGEIGGTIAWTAADPTTGITGYKIYWGSNATTKLAGNDEVVYMVEGAGTESQAVADNTDLPTGATHFLIYSYNASGDSASCLAVAITDLIPAPAVLPTDGSFIDTDEDADEIGGTILWMAANPADGIDGYKIYWGEDATTKLEENDAVVYTVVGAYTESQAVAADTEPPAGAVYFLIYSYNVAGESESCLAVPIHSYSDGDGNLFIYTIEEDGTATIVNFIGSSTEVVIPSALNGDVVTRIGNKAFWSKGLTGVTIPGSVTSIGEEAFSWNQLAGVTIPNSVTTIEKQAFEYNYNTLTSVTLGSGMVSIGDNAFYNCKLDNITIPDNVLSIGKQAFTGATNNIASIVLGSSLQSIGDYAFSEHKCPHIAIPANVTSIGLQAFASNHYQESSLTIYGYADTNAQSYANSNYHTFIALLGAGTEISPYLIQLVEDLMWLSLLNGAADGFSGKYFKQTSDIDMASVSSFSPIGDEINPFKGSYDGDNHKISSLTVNGDLQYAGMFDLIDFSGEVKSLTLEDVTVTSTYDDPANQYTYVGGIAARNQGTILACHIIGESLISSTKSICAYAGGIAGNNEGTISMCSNAAEITTGGENLNGMYSAGGIAGHNYGTIEDCFNKGNISDTDSNAALIYMGGIAGQNSFTSINHCYSTGSITLVGNKGNKGGIVGSVVNASAAGHVTDSFFLEGSAEYGIGARGFDSGTSEGAAARTEAQLRNPETFAGWSTDKWSFAMGSLPGLKKITEVGGSGPTGSWADNATAAEDTDYTKDGDIYTIKTATGLAWLAQQVNDGNSFSGKRVELESDLDISDHYWMPIGTASPNYYSFTGIFDGKGHKITGFYIGTNVESPGTNGFEGLFGIIGSDAEVKNLGIESAEIYAGVGGYGGILAGINFGKVANCYTKGKITGANGVIYVGGLVASNEGGLIVNSYSAAGVAGGNYESNISPLAGGLVGKNTESNSNYGTIVNCFATGNVSVGSGGAPGYIVYAGGLVGENANKGRIENCFAAGNITSGASTKIGGIVGFLHNGFQEVTNVKNVYWNSDAVHTLNGTALNPGEKKGTGEMLVGSDTTTSKTANDIKISAFAAELNNNIINSTSIPDITYFAWGPDEGNENNGYPVITNVHINTGGGAVTYTVTYNGNGATSGTVPTDSSSYAQGSTVTVLGNTGNLIKSGYTFAGWNAQANGSGISYAVGESFTIGNVNVTLYAKWTAVGGGGNGSEHTSTPAPTPTPTPANNVPITIDDKTQQQAATVSTQTQNGKTVTRVTLDTQKMTEIINSSQTGSTLNVPITGKADVAVGELDGQLIKAMENKQAVIEIRTDNATYTLPAQQINIDAVSTQLGEDVKLSDIKVSIEIAKTSNETVKVVEDTASKGNFFIVVPPVEFKVSCTYGNKTVEVSQFNNYVERTVAIPEGVDPTKITTGVVVGADGTVRHVPTKIVVIDGKYYAQINSLTNSTYSVVWNPVEFKDAANHWAKEAINDMGSRMIISGVGNGMFDPGADITRAEFAAIIVRALGLTSGSGKVPFTDIKGTDWYSGYVITAAEYKLISGYGNGKFGPTDKITQEQAMVIIARAMSLTGLEVQLTSGEIGKLLSDCLDTDGASEYAKGSIAACIKLGIVAGGNDKPVTAKDNITKAEIAVIVRRLLQKSNLI